MSTLNITRNTLFSFWDIAEVHMYPPPLKTFISPSRHNYYGIFSKVSYCLLIR